MLQPQSLLALVVENFRGRAGVGKDGEHGPFMHGDGGSYIHTVHVDTTKPARSLFWCRGKHRRRSRRNEQRRFTSLVCLFRHIAATK